MDVVIFEVNQTRHAIEYASVSKCKYLPIKYGKYLFDEKLSMIYIKNETFILYNLTSEEVENDQFRVGIIIDDIKVNDTPLMIIADSVVSSLHSIDEFPLAKEFIYNNEEKIKIYNRDDIQTETIKIMKNASRSTIY